MSLYISEVKSITDSSDGELIKARVLPADRNLPLDKIPYAFPLLPKMLHIKPKVGESVIIMVLDEENQFSQRFYIGPIVSQPQAMYNETWLTAGSLLNGAITNPLKAPSLNPNTHGSYANDSDVAIYGRRDSDIILGDKDLRIRCGARQFSSDNSTFTYNRKNPSFIKLTEYDDVINRVNGNDSTTSVSIVADEINLLSHNGNGATDSLVTKDGEIPDEEAMKKIINKAHLLPYGDTLVDFLTMFLQMFKSHTHKYANMAPCPDDASKKLDMKYGSGNGQYTANDYDYSRGTNEQNKFEDVSKTFSGLGEKLLSKHVRIN